MATIKQEETSNLFIFLCGSSLKQIFYEQNSRSIHVTGNSSALVLSVLEIWDEELLVTVLSQLLPLDVAVCNGCAHSSPG